jgi:hypothetical protein
MSKTEKVLYPVRIPRPNFYYDFNEDWYVGLDGDLLDRRTGYHIPCDELRKDHWFAHLKDKLWFDADTFLPAYFRACELAGLKVVKLRIDY